MRTIFCASCTTVRFAPTVSGEKAVTTADDDARAACSEAWRADATTALRSGANGRASIFSVLLIDTANVVGSRPTGWWRDRAGATRQLIERVRAAAAADELPVPVVMVVEGVARRGVHEGVAGDVEIVHARGEGDDTMAEIAAAASEPLTLVSADRGLRARVRRPGVEIVGPRWLLDRLPG
jgi:hypothetical protein